jgi:hypothetical protein
MTVRQDDQRRDITLKPYIAGVACCTNIVFGDVVDYDGSGSAG